MGGNSTTTLIQMIAESQLVSIRGIIKVPRVLVDFLCLGRMTAAKTKPAKYEVVCCLNSLRTKHYSAGDIHSENFHRVSTTIMA